MRYFFEVAYKGTDYHGWQKQSNAHTVQEEIEEHLSTYLQEKVETTGSGRTDTGVHCEQQFFHCDINREFTEDDLFKVNSYLPDSIVFRAFWKLKPESHARFDAISRRYEYRLMRIRNPFFLETSYLFLKPLDLRGMNEAALLLHGKKDFKCFSKVKTQVNNYICSISEAEWKPKGDLLTFTITGNRFLRGMVRAIVGTLLEVGEGKRTIEELQMLLESGKRTEAGISVPARGLILKEVNYPENYFK